MQMLSSINTPQNKVFQHFLAVIGKMVHADLVRQNEYLIVENKILRSKPPQAGLSIELFLL